MSQYQRVRAKMAEQAASDGGSCAFCHGTAAYTTLEAFGARCGTCYAAYCAEPLRDRLPPHPKDVPGVPARHQWAHRLMAKRDAGERLSHAQLDALKVFKERMGAPAP